MVLLTTTPQTLSLIASLPPTLLSTLEAAAAPDALPTDVASPISHKALISLSQILRRHRQSSQDAIATIDNPITLDILLRGTRVYKPPPPSRPSPTPEYVALMTRLRAEEERREYVALLAQQDGHCGERQELNDDSEEDPLSPSLVLNILLSVVFCAIAVFYATRWWAKDGIRVLVSLAAGIVVGIAEAVVYAGFVRNVKRGRAKERTKQERKIVVGEFMGGEGVEAWGRKVVFSPEKEDGQSRATEVIWGKGKHGGLRRRVREKWEREMVAIDDNVVKK